MMINQIIWIQVLLNEEEDTSLQELSNEFERSDNSAYESWLDLD